MFRESFPQPNNEEQEPLANSKAFSEVPESNGATVEKEQFGWNDVIISDDNQDAAEKMIRDLGFACKDKQLSQMRYADLEKTSWLPGEVLLSITRPNDSKPVDRETLRQIMVALKENEKQSIAVRIARLAPGESFG